MQPHGTDSMSRTNRVLRRRIGSPLQWSVRHPYRNRGIRQPWKPMWHKSIRPPKS